MVNNIANKYNSFRQTNSTWLVKFITYYQNLEIFEKIFDEYAITISYFEYEANANFESDPDDKWIFEAFFDYKPEQEFIKNIIIQALEILDFLPDFIIEKIEDKDWVSEVQKNSVSFNVERFFIYSSYHTITSNLNKYPLLIDAGRAFGTGEHETTSLCLEAIYYLSKKYNFHNMLDMGCGSGILAIAMAKIWKEKIFAVDIDSVAVGVARVNARKNFVNNFIKFNVSNGYLSKEIIQRAKFDLITANILAKPLIKFAPYLKKSLSKDGIAILSGLLNYQEKAVIKAHLIQGLKLVKIFRKNSWSAIILTI